MKFTTEDMNDIVWMRNPDDYGETGKTIRRIMDAGKWDEFLEINKNDDGEVDCDSLYDYLRYESGRALQDVGLHDNEATATVEEVVAAWEGENAPAKVKRDENGKPCATIYLASSYASIDLEVINEDGEEDTETVYNEDVVELMRDKHHGNANTGEWDCDDIASAEFEMWREE